jgi:HEPN domain-containing protein
MSPNERLFKKEYAPELLRIAQNDFLSGQALAQVRQVRKETVLFHFEQAVEKALKSVLCHLGEPIPLTHDIYALVQKFDASQLPPGGYGLHDLTPFATIRRYEEGNDILDDKDVQAANSITQQVLDWAQKMVGS